MMKLEGISTFVAVAEAGSISEAARRLRLSKSIVSERLAELERQIGAVLLHRTTRKLSLTEDGAAFLERASRITRDVEEAAADMAQRRGMLVGPLRISVPVTFGRMHLGPALYPFLLAHPDIELSLDLDDRRVDVAAGGYDAVVRHGSIVDSRLMTWRLATSQRVLVASPAYLDRHGIPATIEELDRHKGIFYANRGAADWSFATETGAAVVRGRIGLRVNNGDMMRDAAIAGIGIALLPTFIAGMALKSGQLQAINVGVKAEVEHIFIAHPEGRMPSAKLRALADHLRKAFGSPAYWDS
ncbi:LysR family transcriptional regulator [Phyllobacterium zundukense]|uniref:LysR family transcriptional regulator n=1 Tax=Phyllobacterium zundukense TaxID=1867719 RepID=A0A2N9W3U3_9HYPH|nr:LysR family transcriptional regulator [Phyllobacterium zundukense]ATU92115.1 LysR family transcriptional regulator [Phyllobacterium zundukense]PIO46411.1 LysR family transcriptional regulator [Phyllobacterium zundukense]